MKSAMFIYFLLVCSVNLVSVISDCPPGEKTDDAQGRCCVFPFTYGGKSYSFCTSVDHNRLWCSFDAVYSGQWANCVSDCPPGRKTDDAQGRCCIFPFMYSGLYYYSCTTVDNGIKPWCSVYNNQSANCVNECHWSSPCKNGASCIPTDYGYSCQPCPTGWQGKDCDQVNSGCPTPALKTDDPQGRCCYFPFTYLGKTYHSCTTDDWHRPWCSFEPVLPVYGQLYHHWAHCVSNPCTSSPCWNGATCIAIGEDTHDYECKCTDSYYGPICEYMKIL